MPSFTFVSTADAFVLRGAKVKFVDIRKDTMNIEYKSPVIVIVDMFEIACPLCASVDSLPPMEESDDLGNLGWS